MNRVMRQGGNESVCQSPVCSCVNWIRATGPDPWTRETTPDALFAFCMGQWCLLGSRPPVAPGPRDRVWRPPPPGGTGVALGPCPKFRDRWVPFPPHLAGVDYGTRARTAAVALMGGETTLDAGGGCGGRWTPPRTSRHVTRGDNSKQGSLTPYWPRGDNSWSTEGGQLLFDQGETTPNRLVGRQLLDRLRGDNSKPRYNMFWPLECPLCRG